MHMHDTTDAMYISKVDRANHSLKHPAGLANLIVETSPTKPSATRSPGTQIAYIDLSTSSHILSFLFSIGSILVSVFYAFVFGLILLSLCFVHVISCRANISLRKPRSGITTIQGSLNVIAYYVEEARKKIGVMEKAFQIQSGTASDNTGGTSGCAERDHRRVCTAEMKLESMLGRLDILERGMLQKKNEEVERDIRVQDISQDNKTATRGDDYDISACFHFPEASNRSREDNSKAAARYYEKLIAIQGHINKMEAMDLEREHTLNQLRLANDQRHYPLFLTAGDAVARDEAVRRKERGDAENVQSRGEIFKMRLESGRLAPVPTGQPKVSTVS